MDTNEAQQKHEAAMLLGRLGGRAGRGESKRRPLTTERARAMVQAKRLKKERLNIQHCVDVMTATRVYLDSIPPKKD